MIANRAILLRDVFVLSQKQFSTTTTSKNYIKAFVADKTQSVTARIWNANRQLFDMLPDSGFVLLRGRLENYQGNLQMIIEDIRPCAMGDFDIADLVPHTTRNIPAMRERVMEICRSVQNRALLSLLEAYLEDAALMDRLTRSPAGTELSSCVSGRIA